MGYNLKSARNENSVSKISQWLSLRSLALKSKFGRQFELLENLEYIYGKALLSNNFFHTNLLNFYKIQTVISFFDARGLKLGHCFRHAFSISGILKVAAHNFMKSRSCDGLAAKGLFPKKPT